MDGVFITPTLYTRVYDSNGNVVMEAQQERRRVMSEAAAYVLTDVLIETGRTGTARNVSLAGIPVASKTGTTDNAHDRWFVAFTPYFTGAVWYGFEMPENVGFAPNPASVIWQGVMRRVHDGFAPRSFTRPDGVVFATVCMNSGSLASARCSNTRTEMFVRGTVPANSCDGIHAGAIATQAPSIVLNGSSNIVLNVGEQYVELRSNGYRFS
ncbi:MAG: penicillin-binding transpeptidase domain-containing protein [Oscillospiraceae bacterium]|nr:penicillin-binding transpeptidase domain-containing protein [Oscillospiraceae bacterium]